MGRDRIKPLITHGNIDVVNELQVTSDGKNWTGPSLLKVNSRRENRKNKKKGNRKWMKNATKHSKTTYITKRNMFGDFAHCSRSLQVHKRRRPAFYHVYEKSAKYITHFSRDSVSIFSQKNCYAVTFLTSFESLQQHVCSSIFTGLADFFVK